MHFDLKKPCKDCPFLPGSCTNTTLKPGRIDSIIKAVHEEDLTFACHKTTDRPDQVDWQHCAGALIHLEKSGDSNQMVQLAERLGLYDPSKLDMSIKVIEQGVDNHDNQNG
jgi:hypothetical protein